MRKKVGLVACSDPLPPSDAAQINTLCGALSSIGLDPVLSDRIFARDDGFAGSAAEKAAALMEFYRDADISYIFDISGGDMANEVLSYLDFELIAASGKIFCGYSDLTTVVNSVYTAAGQEAYLYYIGNLLSEEWSAWHKSALTASLFEGQNDLFDLQFRFLQKEHMEGVMVGGNIRCFLKLAGTPFMPDLTGKILLLESCGGNVARMTAYLNQLKLMGAFDKLSGIVLGGFIEMEADHLTPDMPTLVRSVAGDNIPIAKTDYIGHFPASRAAVIGRYYVI